MATTYTSLLGLALPATGELAGTWGSTVNSYLTSYVDAAIAGALTVTADTTLTQTNGGALGSTSSQYAIIIASPASAAITITAPATSKTYIVINTSATYSVTFKASGQTGVVLAVSEKSLLVFNGTDFVKIGASAGGSSNQVQYNSGTGLAGSANFVFDGSNIGLSTTLSSWASNFKVLQQGIGAVTAGRSDYPTYYALSNAYYNGGWKYITANYATYYQQDAGIHYWFTAPSGTAGGAITFTQAMTLDSSGNLGIGTSSPNTRLEAYTSSAGAVGVLTLQQANNTAGNSWGIDFRRTAATANALRAKIYAFRDGNDATGITMSYTNAAGTLTEGTRLTSSGGWGVGTTADPGTGAIYATGNITANYSDKRLKDVIGVIPTALDKVSKLSGVYYTVNSTAKHYGYTDESVQVGVLAQEIEAVLPEIVKPAPFDLDENNKSKSGKDYKTVQYERLVPLLIEAIKELKAEIDLLKGVK